MWAEVEPRMVHQAEAPAVPLPPKALRGPRIGRAARERRMGRIYCDRSDKEQGVE